MPKWYGNWPRPSATGVGAVAGIWTKWFAFWAWTKTWGPYHIEWRIIRWCGHHTFGGAKWIEKENSRWS